MVGLSFMQLSPAADACTSVVVGHKNQVLLGQNYDFAYTHGAIFIHGRGKIKTSLMDKGDMPTTWTSKYSSIVFSQFGRELPASGMNEAGLVIQMLWNTDGNFSEVDSSKDRAISELQWVQYQLDNQETTDAVIGSLNSLHIKKSFAELHYVICDAKATCALIEFENGEAKIYRKGLSYDPSVTTNNSRSNSIKFYQKYKNGDLGEIPKKKDSLNLFARAAWTADHVKFQRNQPDENFNVIWSVLKDSSVNYEFMDVISYVLKGQPPSLTAWSIVFDPKNLTVTLKTKENSLIRKISAATLFRHCSQPDLALDINGGSSSTINSSDFSTQAQVENKRIIEKSYAPIESQFPKEVQNTLYQYAESFTCKP